MLKSYRYRLYPNENQKQIMAKTFGCCRFVYNWGLSERQKAYKEEKKKLSTYSLIKRLTELKKQYPFLCEVNAQALQFALRNLDNAFTLFFNKEKGFPKFKNKKSPQKFQNPQDSKVDFVNSTISVLKLQRIPAVLHRQFTGVVKTITIHHTPSGKYFASVLVDDGQPERGCTLPHPDTTIGVDLGLHTLAVCSDGRMFPSVASLEKKQERLKLLQRRMDKKKKGSSNRNKARLKVARMHEHIANIRRDNIHKITYALTHENQVGTICVETLNVQGMKKVKHLANSLNNASFGLFQYILEYKCRWNGINFIKIPSYIPTSKRCGRCGHINKKLTLDHRCWTCPVCGELHDRDLNAACNIKEFGLKALPSERGNVKPVESATVDDRSKDPKKPDVQGSRKKIAHGLSEKS